MPVPTRCDQCGQVDDHPKVHLGRLNSDLVETFHHDCLRADDEQALRDSGQDEGSGPKVSAVIDACKKGTKGDKLRELITSGTLPQAEGLALKRQLELEAASPDLLAARYQRLMADAEARLGNDPLGDAQAQYDWAKTQLEGVGK